MGMCIIAFLSSWGMHSKIAVAFSPNSLTFHLYLICYLLSLSESFLHCCSLSCSPVFYFSLLFLFSAPWEKRLAFIHFQPQIPGLNPMFWTLQIFLHTLPFSILCQQHSSCWLFQNKTCLVFLCFRFSTINLTEQKEGQADNECVPSGRQLTENQINFLLILLFFFWNSLLSGYQGQGHTGEVRTGQGFLMAAGLEET